MEDAKSQCQQMVLSSYYKKLTSQHQQQLQTLMQISYKLKLETLGNVTTWSHKGWKRVYMLETKYKETEVHNLWDMAWIQNSQ